MKKMRNPESFSEFQLGLVQALADASSLYPSCSLIDGIQCVRLCHEDGDIIFQWVFGQAPMLSDSYQLVPMTEFASDVPALIALYRGESTADKGFDFGECNRW
jgi:hypothetical protein